MDRSLFPPSVAALLPPLRAQESLGEEAIAFVKFYTPDAQWTWYATEYDPEHEVFFGLVFGLVPELGSFMLAELKSVRGLLGLPVERDLHWKPQPLSVVRRLHGEVP